MWQTDAMYACVEGQGAEDAWYETALRIENYQIHGVPFPGSAADIFKFLIN